MCCYLVCCTVLVSHSPRDVDALEGVEAGEDAGAGDAAEDVGAGALHHGHEALVLEDLHAAVHRVLVLDGRARGHHHSPPVIAHSIGIEVNERSLHTNLYKEKIISD